MKRKFVCAVGLAAGLILTSGIAGQAVTTRSAAGAGPAGHEQTASVRKTKIFRSVGPAEAMRMLQSRPEIIFLDVRTPEERARGAIPGSRLVSFFDLVKGAVPLPKDKPIMVVCAVGGRSYMAAQLLSKKGYQEVYNLSGGINAWYRAGLPIVQDPAYANKSAR